MIFWTLAFIGAKVWCDMAWAVMHPCHGGAMPLMRKFHMAGENFKAWSSEHAMQSFKWISFGMHLADAVFIQCVWMHTALPNIAWINKCVTIGTDFIAAKEESNPCMSPCPVGWSHVQAPAWLITACDDDSTRKVLVREALFSQGGSNHRIIVCVLKWNIAWNGFPSTWYKGCHMTGFIHSRP